LRGTGVPFAPRNVRTDHPIRIKAARKKSGVKMIENQLGKISVMPNNLSTRTAIMIKANIRRAKKKAPRGVKKFRVFLLLVAKL
jgi:hypothetical protein